MRPVARTPLIGAALLGALTASASPPPVSAAERGWNTTIVTGAVNPREPRASKALPPTSSSERLETASVPPVEAQAGQASSSPDGKHAGESARAGAGAGEKKPAQQYCINIANAAADARSVWQKKMLSDTEQELDKRIARLEAKTAEYQKWLARRDEYSRKAQEQLVGIFSKMRPDAAAPQLAASDEETAAAILSKLDTRISSAILSEMDPIQAARLTTIMVGAGKTGPSKSARVGPDGRRS